MMKKESTKIIYILYDALRCAYQFIVAFEALNYIETNYTRQFFFLNT